MDFHRVILLLLLASGCVLGNPQWQRQSSLSSPMSMGMKFLDNLRNGMTKTFQGIFGGGSQQGKENFRGRPVRHRLPPPQAIPVSPVHEIGTQAPSSFFTVLHDTHSVTSFPDTQGFTDESFKPNTFFTGDSPFQGIVEEETLPFHQNVEVHHPNTHGGQVDAQQGPSFAIFENGGSGAHGETFQAPFPSNPTFENVESSIPFGNTNHFSLGHGFAGSPGQLPLAPRPNFSEDFQVREDQKHLSQPAQPVAQHHQQHTFLSSRADHPKAKPQTHQKTTSVQGTHTKQSKTPSPSTIVTKPTSHSHFSTQRRTTSAAPEATTFKVIQNNERPVTQKSTPYFTKPTQEPSGNGRQSVHINTGTKIRLAPKSEDATSSEDAQVSSYEFGYGVLDNDTGNQFFHAEKREEGLTKGSYKIQLPDSRIQTVTYLADDKGFHPKITYEGTAKYPEDDREVQNVHKDQFEDDEVQHVYKETLDS